MKVLSAQYKQFNLVQCALLVPRASPTWAFLWLPCPPRTASLPPPLLSKAATWLPRCPVSTSPASASACSRDRISSTTAFCCGLIVYGAIVGGGEEQQEREGGRRRDGEGGSE